MNPLRNTIYNCKQATFLIEKKQIKKLSFREVIFLKIHFIQCTVCKLYEKQSIAIGRLVRQLFHDATQKPETHLGDDVKHDMQERINEELNKN
ncbi:hypothetical protein SAMN05216464_104344 [Mucilaginibacter pineti]|uniref:Zinc-finger n=1 Tax=Mucilaginibacter pineti TaxID=1391627 RepID=A0A1G7B0W1_9SPHI|nr:hypothetical protein [Mucilaginibacter pineti]SDE20651.1 hypothetical protein SAMN05216464_104344 [Mucilaginibacter pineti]